MKKNPKPKRDMRALNRPAYIEHNYALLDEEFRSARYIYHRLLDFEDMHQAKLDEAAELAAPGSKRIGRLLKKLNRRDRWRKAVLKSTRATTAWVPKEKPALLAYLKKQKDELKKVRNADERWKAALKWGDEPGDLALPRGGARRRKDETDEAFEKRTSERRSVRTRREEWRHQLYETHVGKDATDDRRIYWGTWNALIKSVEQAKESVIDCRSQGLAAEWRRPSWDDDGTIAADDGGFRVVQVGKPFWVFEIRVAGGQWVRFRAKAGNWHSLEGAKMKTLKLTRRLCPTKKGKRWEHSVSIAVEGVRTTNSEEFATSRSVSFDWGHREFGHERASEGLRAFVWVGDDGERGEIILPKKCRELKDKEDEISAYVDQRFNARRETLGIPEQNRHRYYERLVRSGVQTEEELLWMQWYGVKERRLFSMRAHRENIRKETYLQAIRQLRKRYKTFVFEAEVMQRIKDLQTDEQMERRKRSNRDLTARYLFTQLCEQLGATKGSVSSKNTTRECPSCAHIGENGPELVTVCPACGVARDKDYGAAVVILRRFQKAEVPEAAE